MSATAACDLFSTVCVTVNRYWSLISILREKTRPSPLSQVSVTGLPSVSTAPAGAVHSVLESGSFASVPVAGTKPCSANSAPGVPLGERKVMVGLLGSIVSR